MRCRGWRTSRQILVCKTFLLTFFCARIQIYLYRIGCNGTLGLLQIGDAITMRISNVLSNRVSVIIHFQALSFSLLNN